MAILQSKESELRYLKRKNLEQESRTIGNYYRDIIRSYGIDCLYHKLDTSFFDSFKTIVDKNTIIEKAYGINIQPDYSISANMLTYPEVEQGLERATTLFYKGQYEKSLEVSIDAIKLVEDNPIDKIK